LPWRWPRRSARPLCWSNPCVGANPARNRSIKTCGRNLSPNLPHNRSRARF
jgi:hypothetical protein